MRRLVFCLAMVASSAFAQSLPQSGDVVAIGDFEYVVLSRADYEHLKASIDYVTARISAAHSNETGRVALHGRRGHTTITNGIITVEYADGYRYADTVRANAIERANRPKTKSVAEKVEQSTFERRRSELKKRRDEAAGKVTEVTVTKEVR